MEKENIVKRLSFAAVLALLFAATALLAEEYKGATIKKLDKENKEGNVLLMVKDKEVRVLATPAILFKAYDLDGSEIRGFGANAQVLKEGNVVDVKTAKSSNGKQEVVKEIRLIKGQLAK
jgi:hypothetical protein